jgi:hypothetical protein
VEAGVHSFSAGIVSGRPSPGSSLIVVSESAVVLVVLSIKLLPVENERMIHRISQYKRVARTDVFVISVNSFCRVVNEQTHCGHYEQ